MVHNTNRSHSPTPSVASYCSTTSSSSSGSSSVVTHTTKLSCMTMSIASSPSASRAHPSPHQAASSSSPAQVFHQHSSQVPSSQAQSPQDIIPSSSSQVVPSSQAAQTLPILPPPLWTDQFACAVTTTIQQEVDRMIQHGTLPVQSSNNTFCDTLTPLDLVRCDDVLGSGAFSNVTRVSIRTMNRNNNNNNKKHCPELKWTHLKQMGQQSGMITWTLRLPI
mmetsp:Transcript_17454/g.19578  ORF Transcript_17454/g.19578 Transcript_17454/m.19578 type:complete len:221 (+) Transcript_17454:571-1233(+)